MRTLCLLLLLLVAVVCASKDILVPNPCVIPVSRYHSELAKYADSWKNCYADGVKLDRLAIIDYFKLGFDLNHDGRLSMDECETARNCYFNAAERQAGETCKTVFDRCDCDQDKFITRSDFERSFFTCLKDCTAGQMIYKYIGQRLGNGTAYTKCTQG